MLFFFFFSSRRRHTRFDCDWSSDVCSSDLVKQDVCVRTDTVGAPYELTRIEVECADVAADTKLSSRDTHEYFVANYQRSPCHRLTQFRITVLGGPKDLAGLRVECVDLCV